VLDQRSTKPKRVRRRAAVALALAAVPFFLIAVRAEPIAAPPLKERRTYTAEESRKLGDEAQRLAEARQRVWDLKMRAVSGSICTGC